MSADRKIGFDAVKRRLLTRDNLVIVGLLIASFAIRAFDITARPLHSDEGVNYHFTLEVLRRGFYPYSHENYHGPAFFYMLSFFEALLPTSELSLRMTSILFGTLLVILPFRYQRLVGWQGAVIAALLLLVSPSEIFHSRYAIHEVMYLFFQVLLGFEVLAIAVERQLSLERLLVSSFALALLMALKETFFIPVFWIFAAAFLIANRNPIKTLREIWGNRESWWQNFLGACLFCVVITTAIFTAFFFWSKGIREFFLAFPQWFGRGTSSDVGHFEPFLYYTTTIMLRTEPWLFVVALIALYACYRLYARRISETNPAVFFFSIWAAGSWITYSLIPYKTPWLVINITYPALIAFGVFLSEFTRAKRPGLHFAGIAISLLVISASFYSALFYNYSRRWVGYAARPYGDHNPYSYVHTSPGFLTVVEKVMRYKALHPDARILIAVPSYWPLPFYFRAFPESVGYLITDDLQAHSKEYSVLIAENNSSWRNPDFSFEYQRLSDVQESFIYFRGSVP